MKLYIDTSRREKTIVRLDDIVYESGTEYEKSQMLISFIENCLSKNNKQLTDISEVEVMAGSGSFTGLRVGVSVGQALGWSLKIPVNGLRMDEKKFIDIQY